MPRISEDARRQRLAARDRVLWVLSNVFFNGQRRMADTLGVSQSQLSRIANGLLGPSPDILSAIARLPELNPEWVLHGQGEPRLPSTRGTLPVSITLLPGPPSTCPHLLTGDRHVVAEALENEWRYWWRVSETSPLLHRPTWMIRSGDLLLMDASRDCLGQLEMILNKFVGVDLHPEAVDRYVVGLLVRDGERIVLVIDRPVGRLVLPLPKPKKASPEIPVGERASRKVRILEKEREKAQERKRQQAEAEQQELEERTHYGPPFTLSQIVAVCVYMVRPSVP